MDETWIITDYFMRRWRAWLVPVEDRSPVEVTAPWERPEDPLVHMIYYSFTDDWALCDDMASDLIDIYDALTGAALGEELPEPTHDPRRVLRGFKDELQDILYAAAGAGTLKFERIDVPWPFPEKEEKPEAPRSERPADESEATILYQIRLHDALYQRCASVPYKLELASGQIIRGNTDGSGLLKAKLPKRNQTIRVTYTPSGSDFELILEHAVVPETKADQDYMDHLRNMGFVDTNDQRVILRFQAAHTDLEVTGNLDDKTKAAIGSAITGQLKTAIG